MKLNMPELTDYEKIKQAEDVEGAEKARKEALLEHIGKLKDVKFADLEDKYVLIKDVTDYGNLFNPKGDEALVFHIATNGDVYENTFDDKGKLVTDDSKNKLVITLDAGNNKIDWLQDHVEQQPFETFNSLRSSKFIGDAGMPLLEALQHYIRGTYNIAGYDTRLVSLADLANDVQAPETPAQSDTPTSSAKPASSAEPTSATPAKSDSGASASAAKSAGQPSSQPASQAKAAGK